MRELPIARSDGIGDLLPDQTKRTAVSTGASAYSGNPVLPAPQDTAGSGPGQSCAQIFAEQFIRRPIRHDGQFERVHPLHLEKPSAAPALQTGLVAEIDKLFEMNGANVPVAIHEIPVLSEQAFTAFQPEQNILGSRQLPAVVTVNPHQGFWDDRETKPGRQSKKQLGIFAHLVRFVIKSCLLQALPSDGEPVSVADGRGRREGLFPVLETRRPECFASQQLP